jgi:uncharacterized protein (DUF2062 family)
MHVMGLGAWLSPLPALLKVLVIVGIVVGGFAVGAAFVVSTLSAWRYLAEVLGRRKKDDRDGGSSRRT